MNRTPAAWFPDPFRRHEFRYWDGIQWTPHVASRGRSGFDAPIVATPPRTPTNNRATRKVQRAIRTVGVDPNDKAGGGTLLTEQIMVVSQKAKLIEVNAEYAVYNQHGQQIGAVREIGQSLMKRRWQRGPNGIEHTGCR